ncbi:MAG: glycosyltransferase family 2 protein [Cyanobacteria bacterium]|nr:glycosyltransferase family 2 protein [Cyanobacteriota bacterium]
MISVIVPAYNEEKVIKNILSDLISQNYTNFEILVIAHNCSDDTFQKAKEIVDQKIRIIEYNTQDIGKALALNKGLQEAKGEFVAQFDSDNRIKDSNFFKKAIAYFEDPNVKGIQCEVATSNPNSSFVSFMISLENDIFKETSYYGRSVIGLNCILAGTGVILRKKDLLEIGGWNNSLVEDFELSTRYSLKKKKIIFANDLKIYDEKPTTWHDMISQRRRWIKGYLQVFWKNITSFGNFVDYVYRFSPLSIFAWWMSTLIYAIYFFNNRLPIFNFINFFWISMTLIFIILVIYILFKLKKYDRKKILLLCFLYWLFEFHWLWVGLTGLTVNTWSNTKTVHHGDFSFMEGTKVEK